MGKEGRRRLSRKRPAMEGHGAIAGMAEGAGPVGEQDRQADLMGRLHGCEETGELFGGKAFHGALRTRTAQTLNSGMEDSGSSTLLVRALAAPSAKWNGMKTTPGTTV